ncbi:MAG: DUF2163 domain-containing protein [Alphaproteobacteria bacterium]|nr:DUF2163 domain-containing protein [Alphaproteobacteria bacterium]
MRKLAPDFAAHLASGATTLCTCWRLARTDGIVLGFTDHDAALAFAGTDYLPASGGDGSEQAQKLGGATDTSELVALITSTAITDQDIRLGRYGGAIVETFRVNWRDVAQRHLMRRDRIGEIVLEDKAFRAELRSAQAALNCKQGRIYQALCGTSLGSAACGIALDNPAYRASGSVLGIAGTSRLRVAGLSGFDAGWFAFGRLAWSSGIKHGLIDTIAAHGRDANGDWLELDGEVGDWVAPGDGFVATAGCDRLFSTCRERFGNTVNFRGFPHVPGSDFVLTYPKQGEALDGAPLIK